MLIRSKQTAAFAYRLLVDFQSEEGIVTAMEGQDMLLDPAMDEPLLKSRERGKRIVRRRREEKIAERHDWGSWIIETSHQTLRPHILLTEDHAIRRWVHMHQYWDVERRIWKEKERSVMTAHNGEEISEEGAPDERNWFYEHSAWLYSEVLMAVNDTEEASQIINDGREEQVLWPQKDLWGTWIDALRNEYYDFGIEWNEDNPENSITSREWLEHYVEEQDQYGHELAWAQGIFGPYP